jgi:hypothetical protein
MFQLDERPTMDQSTPTLFSFLFFKRWNLFGKKAGVSPNRSGAGGAIHKFTSCSAGQVSTMIILYVHLQKLRYDFPLFSK